MALLRAAVVGCGDVAGGYDEHGRRGEVFTHAGAYRRHSRRVRLAACADPDAARRRAFQKAWNVPAGYDNVDAMLAAGPYDIVSVCSPDALHERHLNAILASGAARTIWTEKPLTTGLASARRLVLRARKAGVGLRLSNHRRWDPSHVSLARRLRAGLIGEIVGFHVSYVRGLVHIGCTAVDTLRMLLGEPTRAQALPPFGRGTYPGDPSTSFLLRFGRASGVVHGVDAALPAPGVFEIEIIGSRGRVRLLDNGRRLELRRAAGKTLGPATVARTLLPQAFALGLKRTLDDLDAGRSRGVAEAVEGVNDLRVIEAVRLSQKRGGAAVDIPERIRS